MRIESPFKGAEPPCRTVQLVILVGNRGGQVLELTAELKVEGRFIGGTVQTRASNQRRIAQLGLIHGLVTVEDSWLYSISAVRRGERTAGTLKVWDLEERRELQALELPLRFRSMTYDPHTRGVVLGGRGEARIFYPKD